MKIEINGQRIGDGEPCFIIAEAGVNHNGSVEMAFQLVDAAVAAGADAVKFQMRKLTKLYPQALLDDPNSAEWAFQYLLPILKQVELTEDDFRQLKAYCDEKGIRFMCTPWDEESLDFLDTLGLDIYKVASADLVNLPLLEAIANTGKPMILSTGMASWDEIACTVEFLQSINAQFAILHCVSTYPAPFENLNLKYLHRLQQFGVPVGYSSHERGIVMPVVAVSLGATIIEKHVTLDRTLPGPDHAASLEPQGLGKMVRDIRNAELAMGTGGEKTISAMENLNRQVLRKSLVAARALLVGTVVSRADVQVKGPGKGLSPQRIHDLVGKKLHRALAEDDYFTEADLLPAQNGSINRTGLRRTWGLKARFHDLEEILEMKPDLVELHFSENDVAFDFKPPAQPYPQQLFVHAPEFADQQLLDLCSSSAEIRAIALDLFQRTIDKAVAMQPHFTGPVGVVIHVGGMSMDEPIHDRHRLLRNAMDAFRLLDPKGTWLLPENLPPRPWYLGGQWYQNVFIRHEEMVEFCQELGVGMTLDISHAQLYCNHAGVKLTDFVRECLPFAKHLHIADAKGIDGEGVQIGEGVVAWDDLMPLLAQGDFSWLPEIWSGHLNNGAGFITAIDRLSRYGIL